MHPLCPGSSFNGKFRDECLSFEWFRSRAEAKVIIESWRQNYTAVRPHSSLGYLTPNEFVAQLTNAALGRAIRSARRPCRKLGTLSLANRGPKNREVTTGTSCDIVTFADELTTFTFGITSVIDSPIG